MAITLNKLAIRCEKIAIASGKITPTSSARESLFEISRYWRRLCDATAFKLAAERKWSEREEMAAGVIVSAVTYLRRIGCKNIEQLLKDTINNSMSQK